MSSDSISVAVNVFMGMKLWVFMTQLPICASWGVILHSQQVNQEVTDF